MKIILMHDVGGVGKRHEVKDVSDGYALNFLIPRGLAEQATKEKLAAHEKHVAEDTAKKAKEGEALKAAVKSLNGARIQLTVRATEKGGLFKTIGPQEIARALREQKSVSISPDAVHPLGAIKTIGDHLIKIGVGDAESEIVLKIVAA